MPNLRLVSFLGTGDYKEATYEWVEPAGSPRRCRSRFATRALAEFLGATEILVLATEKAMEVNREPLEIAVREACLPEPRFELLPEGKNHEELWLAFDTLKKALRVGPDADAVLDVTHGFRSIPFFGASVVAFLRAVDDTMRSPRIVYAAHEAKTNEGTSPIWDLTTFLDVVSWALALHLFLKTGRAEGVVAPTEALARRLAKERASQGGPVGLSRLRRLAKRLEEFSADLGTVRTGALLIGSDGRGGTAVELLREVSAARDEVLTHLPPLADVLDRVRAMVEPLTANVRVGEEDPRATIACALNGPDGHRAVHELSRLYLDLERYPEAVATVREGWLSLYGPDEAALPGRPACDKKARDAAEERWRQTSEPRMRELAGIRNDIEHAGYRKDPASATSIRTRIRALVDAFGAASVAAPRQVHGGSVFFNISNHPSADWSDVQLSAARALAENICDVSFPDVPPDAGRLDELIARVLDEIPPEATHAMVMGEHTLTLCLVRALQRRGVKCFAATTRREVSDHRDGSKTSRFEFVRFREYPPSDD